MEQIDENIFKDIKDNGFEASADDNVVTLDCCEWIDGCALFGAFLLYTSSSCSAGQYVIV